LVRGKEKVGHGAGIAGSGVYLQGLRAFIDITCLNLRGIREEKRGRSL
jgi:hypothetical protein